MIRLFAFIIVVLASVPAFSQPLTHLEVIRLATENYPLVKNRELIQQSTRFSLDNAAKAFLPQVAITGQATYQSDVTRIPVEMPGIKQMSKDQYRVQGEVSQVIYDGGVVKNAQEQLRVNESIQLQNIEVSLHSVKEKVNQLFFAVLLFDAQLRQQEVFKENLAAALKKVENNLREGTAYQSNIDELRAELLTIENSETEIRAQQKAYREMLALFIGRPVTDTGELILSESLGEHTDINRPEIGLFDLRKKAIDLQEAKLRTESLPRLALFVQGGYGRPGLNMLDNDFAPFALGGVRLNLPLSSLYTRNNQRNILNNQRRQIDLEKESFLLNTRAQLAKDQSEISRFRELLERDNELISLREKVTRAATVQLENGVITTSDFIQKLSSENLARQMKKLHQIQLIKAQSDYQLTSGY